MSAECAYNLARTQQALGQLDDARREYDRALALDPTLAPAALNRGIVRLQQDRPAEAAADLARALELGADPISVHYNLALVDLARGDREAARADLRRALFYDPGHVEALDLQARLDGDP